MKWQNYVRFWLEKSNFEVNKWKNFRISFQNWAYNLHFVFLEFGFMSSLIIFCTTKLSRITKNWVEDAVTFMSKNRHLLNFESAQYKCFLYKFSTRCAEPIFYLVKIQGFFFLIPVLCETFDFESYIQNSCHFWNLESFSFHMRPNLTIFRQNFVFTIYMIEHKLWPLWQATFWIWYWKLRN